MRVQQTQEPHQDLVSSLGATFASSGDEPATIRFLMYPNYGFAIGGAGLNTIVPSGSNHRFYCADAARIHTYYGFKCIFSYNKSNTKCKND